LDGILVENEFITEEEETILIKNLDSIPWDVSQSGRRKQVCLIFLILALVIFILSTKTWSFRHLHISLENAY
jgi:hypothetical protein